MVGGAAGNIVFLGDTDENIQRVSTIGRAFYSESYTKIKNHSPINVSAASGGSTFESVNVGKLMMYSESGNGIMWWGGTGDDAPYSGHGMPLWGGEHTDLIPVTNFNAIRITSSVSGQIVYSIGFLNAAQDILLENTSPYQIDIIPPTVVSHSPISGFSGVQRNASITCTFSEEVTSGSASTSGVFSLSPAHNVSLYRDPSDITTIVMEPNVNLSGGVQYTARVTTGITDRVGNALVSGVIWKFTTVSGDPPPDVTAPVVSGTTPVSGATSVSIDSDVTVLFSEQMLSGTINSTNIFLSLLSGQTVVDAIPAAVTLNASDKKTVTINPSDSLTQATTYHINVTTGVQDLAANPLATIDRARWFSTTTGSLTEVYNVTGAQPLRLSSESSDYQGRVIKVTGACALLNTIPKKITLALKKSGTPTSTITVVLLKGTSTTHSALTQHVIGTMNAATLTTTFADYTFENLNQTQTITTNERIGILYSGESDSVLDWIEVNYNSASSYSGAILDRYKTSTGVWVVAAAGSNLAGVVYS